MANRSHNMDFISLTLRNWVRPFFLIIFAAIVSKLMKFCALWRAEKGRQRWGMSIVSPTALKKENGEMGSVSLFGSVGACCRRSQDEDCSH
jgi:hypothetical protein